MDNDPMTEPQEFEPAAQPNESPPTAESIEAIVETPALEQAARPADHQPQIIEEATLELNKDFGLPRDAAAKAAIGSAKEDLAKKLGIDAAEIELVAFEPVTWNDGSLGCPNQA